MKLRVKVKVKLKWKLKLKSIKLTIKILHKLSIYILRVSISLKPICWSVEDHFGIYANLGGEVFVGNQPYWLVGSRMEIQDWCIRCFRFLNWSTRSQDQPNSLIARLWSIQLEPLHILNKCHWNVFSFLYNYRIRNESKNWFDGLQICHR